MSPIEHEIVDGERTGRTRRSQWIRRTMRYQAVPPSQRGDAPFVGQTPSPSEAR